MGEDLTDHELEQRLGSLFDDAEFNALHRNMSAFNVFEAIGAVRAELRHSNFLAYLMSPSRPHGMGTRPLIALVRSILSRLPADQRPVMALELIAGDLDDAVVYRERHNIDILIELPSLNLVVAIENKVDSKAGLGQLKRYNGILESFYPQHRRLMVFLTPDSTAPDHDGYVAYDYRDVVDTLEGLMVDPPTALPTETQLIIQHYVDMVRRHIVRDERLRSLAVTLYERHKEAFEFIFESRPKPNSLLSVAELCVQSLAGLVIDSSSANLIRFFPKTWDEELQVIECDPTKWSKTGRGLLFEIKTYTDAPGRVNVALVLGPCDPEVRSQVYAAAADNPEVFTGLSKQMGQHSVAIFSRDLLTAAQAKGATFEAQASLVRLAWSDFQSQQLRNILTAVNAIEGLVGETAPIYIDKVGESRDKPIGKIRSPTSRS